MNRWRRAFPVFLVALLVVAACSVSLARAAAAGTHVCDATKSWGPAKSETGQSGSWLLELAAIPAGSVQPAPAMISCAGPSERLALVVDHGPPPPHAPRAPPLA
jgi:hypothetical protein